MLAIAGAQIENLSGATSPRQFSEIAPYLGHRFAKGGKLSKIRENVSEWGHLIVDLFLRIYPVVRGLPHNRLALIVVSGGVGLLFTPVWMPILQAIVKVAFGYQMEGTPSPWWSVLLVAMGLGYHLLMSWLELMSKRAEMVREDTTFARIREHDAPIFNRFLRTVSEPRFKSALSNIIDAHAYTSAQGQLLTEAYYLLEATTNKFNDPTMQSKADELERCVDELTAFTSMNFFSYGPERFCMQPDWNIDRALAVTREEQLAYEDLRNALTPKVKATLVAYDDFIRTGNKRLL